MHTNARTHTHTHTHTDTDTNTNTHTHGHTHTHEHKHKPTKQGVMRREYMVNVHDKSPARQSFIPPVEHTVQASKIQI